MALAAAEGGDGRDVRGAAGRGLLRVQDEEVAAEDEPVEGCQQSGQGG